jgi:hypothetical protein
MISFTLQLPFLLLIPCYSAVLSETPRSRSTSGLGVVEVFPYFSLLFVIQSSSALILHSGNHPAIINTPLAKSGLCFTITKLARYYAKKET